VHEVYILNDKEVYGKGIAEQRGRGQKLGLQIAGNDGIDTQGGELPRAGRKIKRRAPTASSSAASRRTRRRSCQGRPRAIPTIKLFGPTASPSPRSREDPGDVAEADVLTTRRSTRSSTRRGQQFFKDYKAEVRHRTRARTRSTATRR
jgi:branched-chain amino acid transport system substrate-binding protein